MKKIIVTLALAAAAMVGANAQFYLGGTIGGGFNINSKKYDGDKMTGTNNGGLGVGVILGYDFTDKMGIGLKGGITWSSVTDKYYEEFYGADKDITNDVLGWYVTPYFQYAFLNTNGFKLGLQADLNVNGGVYSGDNYNKDLSLVGVGINVKPFVAYSFTNNLSLIAELNFIGIGFNYLTNANNDVYAEKYENIDFGLNINSNQAAASMNLVTFGLTYKF